MLFERLLKEDAEIIVLDKIESQLKDFARIKFLGAEKQNSDSASFIPELLGDKSKEEYGVWVYYPWLRTIIHLLDEEEFVQLRTSRNKYKITQEEQDTLRTKKVGIVGLSVGQTVAVTMALERVCGTLHLADFDQLDLSNMNRISVSLKDLGLNKAVLAARRIAELDPFLNVVCFTEGLTDNNMDDFFSRDGQLDLLVEECDSLPIKIKSRLKARQLGIPVIMDTNDKGVLDVERFDLEPHRELLHGRITALNGLTDTEIVQKMNTITAEERMALTVQIIGMENVSERMLLSLPEINKTIAGWPQLASAVQLGGAMVTDVCRRIFLNQYTGSGRYFIDVPELIN